MIPMCEVFDAYIVAIKSNADCTSVINISLLFTTAISVRKRQILNTGSGALLNIPLFGHSIIAGYMI